MKGTYARIAVNEYNNALCLKFNINSKLSWHETKINYREMKIDDLLYWWILKSLKPLFFEMPLEKIEFTCSKDAHDKFGGCIKNCYDIARLTNEAMKKYSHLKNIAAGNSNIIPFTTDGGGYRYKGLFEKCYNVGTSGISLNMESGWNPKIRIWEDRDIPMPLSELVDIVVKEGIKKIVSINHYVLERYLYKTGVHLIPLFRYLGVEYVIIDQDLWDDIPHGYLTKAFFNCNSFKRFTTEPFLSEHWDTKYRLRNIHYIAIPQNYEDEKKTQFVKEDYEVLVLSNSRLQNVKIMIRSIIYFLDHMPESSIFTEVQLWYISLKYMILKIMKCDEFEQLFYNSTLNTFFFTTMQFLKYEIIDSIDTMRGIEIYGDIGWEIVFPEYYKKLLDTKEMDGLFAEGRHLYLLLNYGLSYLESSGPIYDAINGSAPFINIPPMVKTREFEGFRHIEYGNKEELNCLIENIRPVIDNEELKDSMQISKKILKDSKNEIEETILRDRNTSDDGGMFRRKCEEHKVLLNQMIEEYIDRNEPFLRETFSVLFQGKPVQYDISKSKYFNKKYVQRILKSIHEEQNTTQ